MGGIAGCSGIPRCLSQGEEQQADNGHREDQAERKVEDRSAAAGWPLPGTIVHRRDHHAHDRASTVVGSSVAIFSDRAARAGVTPPEGAAAPSEGIIGLAACDARVSPAL